MELSGMIILSAEECVMSLSCHSATFSMETSAFALRTLASPVILSQVMGFLLCGIADEPFCPRLNGSSASCSSVLCRFLISVAIFSSEAATIAMRSKIFRVPVPLDHLGRDLGPLKPQFPAGYLLHFRLDVRICPDSPRKFPDADGFHGVLHPLKVPFHFLIIKRHFQAECNRLRVDAVASSYHGRAFVQFCFCFQRPYKVADIGNNKPGGFLHQ